MHIQDDLTDLLLEGHLRNLQFALAHLNLGPGRVDPGIAQQRLIQLNARAGGVFIEGRPADAPGMAEIAQQVVAHTRGQESPQRRRKSIFVGCDRTARQAGLRVDRPFPGAGRAVVFRRERRIVESLGRGQLEATQIRVELQDLDAQIVLHCQFHALVAREALRRAVGAEDGLSIRGQDR